MNVTSWSVLYGICTAAMSVVTALLLAWDKRRAVRGGSRVPEATLHLCELLGGWPGSLLVRPVLRHKTRKTRYRLVLGLIVALHVGAIAWWALHA